MRAGNDPGAEQRRVPVAGPALVGNERRYVIEALESTWISSTGRFIDEFERQFSELIGTAHAVSVCNGTAALHVALLALGIGPGDEVLVPSLTYVATANAVSYCGARPVFAESEPAGGNIDPGCLDGLLTERTKAVIAVHLYGHPADMQKITTFARAQGLAVIEDAAEAHGARYRGRPVGALGDIATFSFFGNKIITTGEGGMVLTDDAALAQKARSIRGQGQHPEHRYWFERVGFNYRMTNIAAAIGVAQLENFDWHLQRRRENARWYSERLGGHPLMRLLEEPEDAESSFWMNGVVLAPNFPLTRDATIGWLASRGIETRPFFYPCHTLPPYRGHLGAPSMPVAESLSAAGISLPSSAMLDRDDVAYVCDALESICENSA